MKALHQDMTTTSHGRNVPHFNKIEQFQCITSESRDALVSPYLRSETTRHHISLSYVKNNTKNDFHRKTLWFSECNKFAIIRVQSVAVIPRCSLGMSVV